jgi:hypothetical protein
MEDSSHGFYWCENEILHSGRSTPLTISKFKTHYYHLYFKTQIQLFFSNTAVPCKLIVFALFLQTQNLGTVKILPFEDTER